MVENEVDQNIQDETVKEVQKVEPPKQITLEILKIIKDSQQQHGLRHGDYQRYRGYCSRRIGRLRKVLKIPQGDRRHFKKKEVTQAHIVNPKADERYLQLPLMLAERCWAYAMQLRQESNTEPRKKFHFIQKLRKACSYSLKLEELCKLERCDALTKLEAQAYVAWMHGNLHFELQLWITANENLKKAQVIYEKLLIAMPEEDQLAYKQRIEEIIPSLRYCAYNIGEDKAVDLLELRSQGILESFETLASQKKEKPAEIVHQVKWFNIDVPIRIDKVKLFLLSIENLDESISRAEKNQSKIKILEDMLMDLRDVIAEVRKVVNENKEQLLLSYLLSIRIDRTIHRNLFLIKQTKKPQEVCRLLDIILQQLNELLQFEAMRDSKEGKEHYKNCYYAYTCIRTFYMGKTHALFRRWKEATVTFNICEERVNDIKSKSFLPLLSEIVQHVTKKAALERAISHANVHLDKIEETAIHTPIMHKVNKNKKPLIDRLDEFREDPQLLSRNPNVVSLPPAMVPVSPKPFFFDLAYNHLKVPDCLQEILEEGKKEQKQSAGISGFVKGLWGWGSKK